MAVSPASLQHRVAEAYTGSLIHTTPDRHLPDDLRPLFAEIAAALNTTAPQADEGTAVASALVMSEDQAEDVIQSLLALQAFPDINLFPAQQKGTPASVSDTLSRVTHPAADAA